MSVTGKESRSSTLSEICLAFEDEKNRDFEEKSSKSEDSSESDSDSSVSVSVSDFESTYKFDSESFPVSNKSETKNLKAYICKSVENSKECPYGKKCKFSHSAADLEVKKCTYGNDCNRIKISRRGEVCNMDVKNPCVFIHPSETISSFLDRKGLKGFPVENMKGDVYSRTRMCVSYTQNIKCLKGDECTYAHEIEELKTNPCNFGNKCNNVKKDGSCYINNGE